MDVRCEKCQTEYELDEARLKPGGVTVKCTNCGHMFKIRKRSATNVGAPPVQDVTVNQRVRAPSNRQPLSNDDPTVSTRAAPPARADSVIAPLDGDGPTVPDRQWLIRLENGEQKSCRELAVLQQWIVAGVVTRESLISRTGKTWKRLGDVGELAQYFIIADEARVSRANSASKPPATKAAPAPTMLGVGPSPTPSVTAAGGRIVPDDEDDIRTTGSFASKPRPSTPPPPPPVKATRPPPTPPPQQPLKPNAGAEKSWAAMPTTPEQRSTGAWAATSPVPTAPAEQAFGGKINAVTDEPAFASKSFAGKVRTEPGDERVFSSGPIKRLDEERDDEDMFPSRRGSRSGMLLVVVALLVIGGAAAVIYIFAFKNKSSGEQVAAKTIDAGAVAAVTPDAVAALDASVVVTPVPAGNAAQGELNADIESRLRAATSDDPGTKAHLMLALAQTLVDQASLSTDKAAADKQTKEAKQLVLDAATLAQKQLKAKSDDPAASLAMAEVLRMQNKPGKDIKRYIEVAAANKDWSRDASIATTLVLARDGKLDDAAAALRGLDTDAGDVRPKFHLALIAFQQNKLADVKPLVEQVLATQPEHAGAKALQARLQTSVAKTDPMPTEEPKKNPPPNNPGVPTPPPVPTAMEGYDALIKQANGLAETGNCAKAIEIYQKATAINPSSVEALTGQGYCHIDAKQFSSAFSKFRAALTIKQNYEPALYGIAQAYQQQGRKQDAIDAYKAYLEVYPGSAKAQKQLGVLGGGDAPAPKPPEPAPTPNPTVTPDKPVETPAPAPAPDQGSAS